MISAVSKCAVPCLRIQARSVGPFVFVDHMGPALFEPGRGIDVRPHPHIGLATVTFLWAGTITHRDTLGSVQDIRPGDVNWMTSGRGIAHSERTPLGTARVRRIPCMACKRGWRCRSRMKKPSRRSFTTRLDVLPLYRAAGRHVARYRGACIR